MGDCGNRGVEDGGIEGLHEHGNGSKPGNEPFTGHRRGRIQLH